MEPHEAPVSQPAPEKQVCGIVMPISAIDGCSDSHWRDVLDIIMEAISNTAFQGNLVSFADDAGTIQKRIVQNLYDNPIVVCDVSGKNPNVMFELGLRLAFDKPTIIIKDDKTPYSFDTAQIEHVEYPRDLRFAQVVEFKDKLAAKITATTEKAAKDPNYTTFLKHFGEFKVAKIDQTVVSEQVFILEELKGIRKDINRVERMQIHPARTAGVKRHVGSNLAPSIVGGSVAVNFRSEYCLKNISTNRALEVCDFMSIFPGVELVEPTNPIGHTHVTVLAPSGKTLELLDEALKVQFSDMSFAPCPGE